jgi:uncharacterized protein (DUF302 family)
MSAEHTSDVIEHRTTLTFEATLERLSTAFANAGLTIFASIDHAEAAREVGMTMPPTIVLIYGNPKGGTPIMLAAPVAALDLPLRVLVREDADGSVIVAFHPARPMLQSAGVPEALTSRLGPAQQLILAALPLAH